MLDNPSQVRKRCAIYTRKSTNLLLERDANSLVTQREICSAYVTSQRYRGWSELPQHYDDGGQTGSHLDRPALAELMQDIEAGLIDAVVIYKIDRLTRSLIDFVRLVEKFDARGIGLVSVSQAFDTADSMGRMILNVLLTFSQFERELIGERVRDSIRSRKRHGRIHGGHPPFGYVYTDGELEIVEEEATIVRFIYAEFLRTKRYTAVMAKVHEAGHRSTVKPLRRGGTRGGGPISPSLVYSMLNNPCYVGEIRGHDGTYPGRHQPIISRQTWEAAQALSQARKRPVPHSKQTNHFLAGLLWDDLGRRMRLEVDWHRGKPYYAYASSNAFWSQREFRRAYRSNADHLDKLIVSAVAEFLADRGKLRGALKSLGLFGEELDRLAAQGAGAAAHLTAAHVETMEALFSALLLRIEVGEASLTVVFRSIELQRFLAWDGNPPFRGCPADWPCSDARYDLNLPVCAISAERWPVIHFNPRPASAKAAPRKRLVRLLTMARHAQRLLEEHRDWTHDELAKAMDCRPGHFSRLIRLNYLAPDIITAILDGTQPVQLTPESS